MSVILGLNACHADSAAGVVVDGELKAAVAEERLGARQKHCPDFPANAIRAVLKMAGVTLRDVTHVAIARDTKANMGAKAAYVLSKPVKTMAAVWEHLSLSKRTGETFTQLAEIYDEPAAHAPFQITPFEHHLSPIASSYCLPPFESLTANCQFIGFHEFGKEYKVMGLAPYVED